MISLNNISIHFTGTAIFDNVSFIINDKDRIGLVGKNGAGKTTLLKIIKGIQSPETGNIVIPNGSSVGYLPQEMIIKTDKTIKDEAITAFSEALELEIMIGKYTEEISSREDYESSEYMELINKLNDANERYSVIGGQSMQGDIEKVLLGLGFKAEELDRPMSEFSGGWQMRVELAKILLQRPELILLDEPTNHLDIEAIQWLENFLINYPGAIVLVSHDRAFLDNVTKRTVEISLGKIFDYKTSYSEYVKQRAEQRELQIAAHSNQQKQINDIEKFIDRFRYKSTKSKQVQSRVKMLEKMDKIEVEATDTSAMHFSFPPAPPSGKVVFDAESLTKCYGEKLVLDKIDFSVLKNDSTAFVGRNGEGKTTMAKIIVGELEHAGKAQLGHNVKIGYFAQNQAQMLDPNKTVFETIDDIATGDIRTKIRAILGSFLFSGETIDKKVKILSGGEKARLALSKLLLTPVNLLILDEPTNHLDMMSKDILKNALLKFDGTLIIVSHDRDFLQGLTNKVLEFRNHKIKEHLGDVYDFLESRNLEHLQQLENAKKTSSDKKTSENQSNNKLKWEKKKLLEKGTRKISNQIKKCENNIEDIEQQIIKLDEILANPDEHENIIAQENLYNKYDSLKKQLETEMQNWEKLSKNLEELRN